MNIINAVINYDAFGGKVQVQVSKPFSRSCRRIFKAPLISQVALHFPCVKLVLRYFRNVSLRKYRKSALSLTMPEPERLCLLKPCSRVEIGSMNTCKLIRYPRPNNRFRESFPTRASRRSLTRQRSALVKFSRRSFGFEASVVKIREGSMARGSEAFGQARVSRRGLD